ncbi:MAG: hypothetical protein WAL50_22525 [Kineosporiaceae bacterium]|jgi:hypothetical protein
MPVTARRNTSRRLVLELLLVALLAGFGDDFPRNVSAGTAWSFLGRHALELGHATVGTAVLLEALNLVARSVRGGGARAVGALTVAGLVLVGISAASGVWFVTSRQPDSALTSMTLGWISALVVYATIWYHARQALRAASTG